MNRPTPKQTIAIRTVTLRARPGWDAAQLIDKFGTPICVRLPTNVVDGNQSCGALRIMTPGHILQYKGVLTKEDGVELRRLLDLSGGQTSIDLKPAYEGLHRIQQYLR